MRSYSRNQLARRAHRLAALQIERQRNSILEAQREKRQENWERDMTPKLPSLAKWAAEHNAA